MRRYKNGLSLLLSCGIVLALSGCSKSEKSTETTTTTTSTSTVVSTTAGTAPTSAESSSADVSGGRKLAVAACNQWEAAFDPNLASPEFAVKEDEAAASAAKAKVADPAWTDLSDLMAFNADLPTTGNNEADIGQAKKNQGAISKTCASIGVQGVPTGL